MSEPLDIQVSIVDDRAVVEFKGSIDEDANFDKLKNISQKEFVFNFDGIKMINSCGIRVWISFVEELDSSIRITYKKCPQIIIEQMNMVKGFVKKGAKIESFYAPYFCEKCDEEKKILLKYEQVVGRKAPEVKCEKDASLMEFDDIEQQYFRFIS